MLVYNNRPGNDATLLKQFSEPAWNNPVVRYLDAQGKDLIPRQDGIWTTVGTAERMVAALKSAGREIPEYLSLSVLAATAKTESATFAMHCYWEGEGLLGALDGVYSTRSAWRDGLEVVNVNFDPGIVDYAALLKTAQSLKCASRVFAHSDEQLKIAKQNVGEQAVLSSDKQNARDAQDSDQKYYLRQTPLVHLPLTEFQATKINAALKGQTPYAVWLSQRQNDLLVRIINANKIKPSAFAGLVYSGNAAEFSGYWQQVEARLESLGGK